MPLKRAFTFARILRLLFFSNYLGEMSLRTGTKLTVATGNLGTARIYDRWHGFADVIDCNESILCGGPKQEVAEDEAWLMAAMDRLLQ